MRWLLQSYFRILDMFCVLMLGTMSLMVFSNVVARYLFNTAILSAEEYSRIAFVALTFLGATVAAKKGQHLGFDSLLQAVPPRVQFVFVALSEALIALSCGVLFWGLARQHNLNMANSTLITGVRMEYINIPIYLCAVSIGILALVRLIGLLTGRIKLRELVPARDAEGGVV
jgi:TRAP-type transport system small permease protein